MECMNFAQGLGAEAFGVEAFGAEALTCEALTIDPFRKKVSGIVFRVLCSFAQGL